MTKKLTVIICQGRDAPSSGSSLEGTLIAALGWPDVDVAVLPHLYDLEPDGEGIRYLRSVAGDMIVLAWLHPRATYWVLDAHQIKGRMGQTAFFPQEETEAVLSGPASQPDKVPARTIWCYDLREADEPEPLLAEIERIALEVIGKPLPATAAGAAADDGKILIAEDTRQRWYPVIDYDHCTHCLECLNFCLFGTFGIDESGRLFVEQPDTCRPGCPACSRICPAGAIIFPHYPDASIAGDPHAPVPGFGLDLKQLFAAANPADLAAAERDRALAEKAATEKSKVDELANNDTLDDLVNGVDELDL